MIISLKTFKKQAICDGTFYSSIMLCIAHLHHYVYILSGNYYVLVTNECFKYLPCKFMKFEAKFWKVLVPEARWPIFHSFLLHSSGVGVLTVLVLCNLWTIGFCYSLFMHKITFSALHNDRKFLNCEVLQMWWILLKFWSIIFSQFECLPQCASFVL